MTVTGKGGFSLKPRSLRTDSPTSAEPSCSFGHSDKHDDVVNQDVLGASGLEVQLHIEITGPGDHILPNV